MRNEVKNIVLLGEGFVGWGGGLDFLRFCANALSLVYSQRKIKLTILIPDPENVTFIAKVRSFLSPYKRITKALFARQKMVFYRHKPFSRQQLADTFQNIEGNIEIIFYPKDKDLATVATQIQADVVIPSAFPLGKDFPVPWVGYLYDFQHKYYPGYFSVDEIKHRDGQFKQMLSEASAIIVNSADVAKDINYFFPDSICRIFTLPFSATPIEPWFEPPAEDLLSKYFLPNKYFIISNQLWVHKDHATAFGAFAKYVQVTGHNDVHLVCTGKTVDTRHPHYFTELKQLVCNLGLTDKIHFLGHIPKKDQIDILKGAIAVLQPTLFEGGPGGGAVYDAVAMGVPAVVSDIPVNREIEGYDGLLFFRASDADDMAIKMIGVQNLAIKRPDKEKLLSVGRERTQAFGLRLVEAIEFVRTTYE